MPLMVIDEVKELLAHDVWSLSLTWGSLLGSLGILTLSWLSRKYIVEALLGVLGRLAKKTKTEVDDLLIDAIRLPLRATVVYFGVLLAIYILPMEQYAGLEKFIHLLIRIGGILIIAWIGVRAVRVVSFLLRKLSALRSKLLDDRLVPFVEKILRFVIIVIATVMCLQELGYNPSGLLAGLGLGGLAFALAAKDTLSNFFGSIMLLADKPFGVGDWIKVNDIEGTVETIGFRSTQIRLFDKSLVQVPNGTLATSPIRNFNRRDRRRIYFHVGITYQSTPAMMRAALGVIKQLIEDHPRIRKDFYLVNFEELGDSSLKIMVYCFTTITDWGEFQDIQEELMLSIIQEFTTLGIEFAYPTMTVHLGEDAPEGLESKAQLWLEARRDAAQGKKVHPGALQPESLGG